MTDIYTYLFPSNNFVDLTLYQFGHQDCTPFHANGPSIRNHFLFHYVHSGKGVFCGVDENGKIERHEVTAGQGFMIWPKQVTTYEADGKQPWSYSWVEFDGLKAREIIMESGLTETNPIYRGKNDAAQKKLEDAVFFITRTPDASPYELIGYCYIFLAYLAKSCVYRRKIARSSLQDFYINEILMYIESRYQEDISIDEIASVCNLDKNHVSKMFKSAMGIGLKSYIIRLRINKACEMMKGTNLTIGEIAGMTGHSSLFGFSRSFKSVMGVSPKQWRVENMLR